MGKDLKQFLGETLLTHPRVAQQGLFSSSEAQSAVLAALPTLTGFRRDYEDGFAVLDWDHRIPSRELILRVFGYYSKPTSVAGRNTLAERIKEIDEKNRFPEFDLPDFDSLFAEDAYECRLKLDGTLEDCRLISGWRRDVDSDDGKHAVRLATDSDEYQQLLQLAGGRPSHYGELEAVSWTPPCESQHSNWCVDVWYLLSFDGRTGTGKSLLVDLDSKLVISMRDFSVRAN